MDFPGGALTNFSVFDGFSNIYWRIYAEEGSVAPPSTDAPANRHHILKHLSRLKDLELRLRNLDCLVSAYPRRLGLWIFSSTPGFESLTTLNQNFMNPESNTLLIDATSLKVSAAGATSSPDLIRALSADSQNSSGSRKPQQGTTPGRGDLSSSHAAPIYASFIAAVAGTVSFQLVRRNRAIPLGLQTLYTAIDRTSFSSPVVDNDGIDSVPALTGLKVELTPVGKVIISMSTFYQEGLARLRPDNVQPDLDVWLAPNGTVGRLVSTRYPPIDLLSPSSQNTKSTVEPSHHAIDAKRRIWQATILEWLASYGLPTADVEDETWVEVEVLEPFYAKLAAPEPWRQLDRNQPSHPLKRIPWPLRFCFRRASGSSLQGPDGINLSTRDSVDPIRFAEDWLAASGVRKDKLATDNATAQAQQSKPQDILTPRVEGPESIESLARTAQYPEIHPVSLVYPTPPDGAALPPAAVQVNIPDSLGSEASDVACAQGMPDRAQHSRPSTSTLKHRADSNGTAGQFNPSTELGVGSGLYDTNDDEDLFGEMNDKDFGLKGIGDADFSFFDESDDDHVKNEKMDEEMEEFSPNPSAPPTTNPITDADESRSEDAVQDENGMKEAAGVEDSTSNLQLPASSLEIASEQAQDSAPPEVLVAESKKIISPPLSPVEIKKLLFPQMPAPSMDNTSRSRMTQGTRKGSGYGPVSFERNLALSDQKYSANGSFFFTWKENNEKTQPTARVTDIPTVGIPRFTTKRKHPAARDHTGKGTVQNGRIVNNSSHLRSGSISSDESLDDSSDSDSYVAMSPDMSSSLKRKRQTSEAEDSTASSLEALSIDEEIDSAGFKEESSIFLGNYLSLFSDWSLIGYFSTRQHPLSQVLGRKEDHIRVAQLVVDQITQSSLCHRIDGCSGVSDLESDKLSLQAMLEDLPIIGKGERLDLHTYTTLQESANGPMPDVSTPRHQTQRKESKSSIAKLPAPHLRIRRGRDTLDLLPPAISFWETFGLEPASGPKDISAYCIYPSGAREGADAFINRLGLLYTSCGLGKHSRGDRSKAFENGLGYWQVTSGKDFGYGPTMQALRGLCESLGSALSKAPSAKDNFVIYIVNPYPHGTAYADICSAFLQLFNKFVKEIDQQQPKAEMNELVLQIIPLSFVSSSYSMVVPSQVDYLNLALEIYDRCTAQDAACSILGCAPSVLLADPVPKSINFKLAPDRSSPFSEGRTMHVALSRSLDQRWVTAAWSDNLGSFQICMSYCIRAKGSIASRALSDVRQEIWETTKDIMERFQTKWKILLVRTESVDTEEIESWTSAVERYNQSRSMPAELTILSANVAPGLDLELPYPQIQLNNLHPQLATTPVSTPHANAGSPDQYGTAATPTSGGGTGPLNPLTPTDPLTAIEPDSDTVLIDYSDETWGIILSHRLSNSSSITELRQSLASGYILRRNGTIDSRGVVGMSMNLIYTQRSSTTNEAVLKECLASYRDLASLARAKGSLIVQSNTLPWHIATAARGAELLSYIL